MTEPLARTAGHTLGAGLIGVALGFHNSILIARLLGPAGRGSHELIIATSGLLTALLGLSLTSGITWAVATESAAPRRLAPGLLVAAIVQTAFAGVLLALVDTSGLGENLLPVASGGWVVPATVALFGLQTLNGYWRAVLIGARRILDANRTDVLLRGSLALMLAVAGVGAWLGGVRPGLSWITALTVVSWTLAQAALVARLKSTPSPPRAGAGYRVVARYSLPSYFGNLAQFLNYRMDTFFVNHFLGAASVGLYTLAVAIAQLVWLISSAAATVLLPAVASMSDHRRGAELAAGACRVAFWSTVAASAMLALAAPVAIPMVYGAGFAASVLPLVVLLAGVAAFSVVNVLGGGYLAGIGRPQDNMRVAWVALAVTTAGDLLLIPRLGIAGAALASTASYLTSAVLTVYLFRRKTSQSLASVFRLRRSDLARLFPARPPELAREMPA